MIEIQHEVIFFVSCRRDHKVIGRLKCFKISHKQFFCQLPWRLKGYMEIKMFQDLVLAMFHVSYNRGLYNANIFV